MAFIPFPVGTVEAIFHYFLNGIPVANSLGFATVGGAPATVTDGQNLANALNTWANLNLADWQSENLVYSDCTVYDLTSAGGWVANETNSGPGSITTGTPPNQVSMTVTFQTANRGRSFRGRNYIVGLPEADLQDPKTWGATIIGKMVNAFAALPPAAAAVGFGHVVLSRNAGGHPRVVGVATPVLTYRVNAPVYTQRRRLT